MNVVRSDRPDHLEPLLRAVTWGTDGLRYQVDDVDWSRLPTGTRYFAAHMGGEVVGAYVLTPHRWGFLRSLLAVHPAHEGAGVGSALVQAALDDVGEVVTRGTIEAGNTASLAVSRRHGLQPVGRLLSRNATRFRPRAQPGVRQARPDELGSIARVLAAQPAEGFDPTHLRAEELWVTDDGAAGLQVCRHGWVLHRLGLPPGVDPVVRRLLPLVGVHPRRFRFGVGHYWFGDPARWNEVVEHVLAVLGLQVLTFIGDPTGQPWQALDGALDFGRVGTWFGDDALLITSAHPECPPQHFTPVHGV